MAAEERPLQTSIAAGVSTTGLVNVVQALALTRDEHSVIGVVRDAVRGLISCEGATFVLRDGEQSYYVDESAIGPLFKGKRFPLHACLGGQCILSKAPVIVADVRTDPRVPKGTYETTFVKSLVMVPIRSSDPVGAIGAYWAAPHEVSQQELATLRTLADSAALAFANVTLINSLERRVQERTAELAYKNTELEMFTAAAAHDLRTPLASLHATAEMLLMDLPTVAPEQRARIESMRDLALHMGDTLTSLLQLSRVSSAPLAREQVDIPPLVEELLREMKQNEPTRHVELVCPPSLIVCADKNLLRIALGNLLSNAWKYTSKRPAGRIEVGAAMTVRGSSLFVRDNGAGFDSANANELFVPFKRLHDRSDFPGVGIGLVTVARVAARHGGEAWAEAEPGKGATFYLRLPQLLFPAPL